MNQGDMGMSLQIHDLYIATKDLYQLQLLAGESGATQTVNWVYTAEDMNTFHFLKENELIITTGMQYDGSEDWFINFMSHLIDMKCSGLIINTGKYITKENISDNIIAFCNEHHFPLISMPWHIHISDVTKDFCDRIFLDFHQDSNMDFFKLLYEINNVSMLEDYVEKKLSSILEYDKLHHTEYANTLYYYLKYWGSVTDVAKATFCHRNTIANRMHVIQDEIGMPISDASDRYELLTAFMIKDFLKNKKEDFNL